MENGAGHRFYHRYHDNSLEPQGLAVLVDKKATARRGGRAVPRI
jgi:hypothetical protein